MKGDSCQDERIFPFCVYWAATYCLYCKIQGSVRFVGVGAICPHREAVFHWCINHGYCSCSQGKEVAPHVVEAGFLMAAALEVILVLQLLQVVAKP